MPCIEPDSPRDWGVDSSGVYRKLGDTDSDGHFVGYITAEGAVFESEREHQVAIASGRYFDAYQRWARAGCLGAEPDPWVYAKLLCNPLWVQEAVEEGRDLVELRNSPYGVAVRARAAALN